MSHDFLLSYHEDGEGERPAKSSAPREKGSSPEGVSVQAAEGAWAKIHDPRHRTVGISMSPQLREDAAARAKALGLPLSRYVQWCIEAELQGVPPAARFEQSRSR